MNTEDDEFARIEREARGVPDAIHHTDTSESLEYITGWNDCRAAMLAEQPAQQEPIPCCGKYETCTQACTPRGRFLGKREALAEQEPVAKDNSNYRLDQPGLDPLYTTPQTPKEKQS